MFYCCFVEEFWRERLLIIGDLYLQEKQTLGDISKDLKVIQKELDSLEVLYKRFVTTEQHGIRPVLNIAFFMCQI